MGLVLSPKLLNKELNRWDEPRIKHCTFIVMPKGRIRIRLKAYDHRLVDETCQKIVDTAIKTGATVVGPIPLPTKKEVYVVNKSTFIDKDAREYFGLKIHKRLLDIMNPTNQTIDSLMHLELPAGVEVEVKM